jgi:uncharacterized membrane protein YuzA (DUF378 family)
MALVTRSTTASMDANQAEQVFSGGIAGEALDLCATCYLKTSDGLIWMTNATGSNEAAEVLGFTPRAVAIGQPVTLFGDGTRFKYGTGLTPGNVLYAAATAGRLDTAATAGDAFGAAIVLTDTDIMVQRHANRLTSATVGAGTISVTELANDAVETAIIKNVNVTEAKLAVGAANAGLTGLVVKFNAADNVIGSIPVLHRVALAAGALATKNVTLTHKTLVTDAWVVLTGAGVANTVITVGNVADIITNNMAASGSSGDVSRATNLAAANTTIAAGAALRIISSVGATQPDCVVYVLGLRVA